MPASRLHGELRGPKQEPSTVLFLAANPVRAPALRLAEECREIEEKISRAKYRDHIRFRSRWAARPDDLLQALNEDTPSVLHFSGHGGGEPGLYFQGDNGATHLMCTDALVRAVQAAGARISVVLLNACYSKAQAEALRTVVPCVIGMSSAVGDRAAIAYASSFYRALAFGSSIRTAHEQGLAALAQLPAPGTSGEIDLSRDIDAPDDPGRGPPPPTLWTHPGVDASQLHIVRSDMAVNLTSRLLILASLLGAGVTGASIAATHRCGPSSAQSPVASDAAVADPMSMATVGVADAPALELHDAAGPAPDAAQAPQPAVVSRSAAVASPGPLREANRLVTSVKNRSCSSIRVAISTLDGVVDGLATIICQCDGRETSRPILVSHSAGSEMVLDDSSTARLLEAARSLTCDRGER